MATIEQATPLVSSLRVVDLKSFRGAWEVELAPLTLIYGANSAGKSTLLQAVRMIQQYDVFERFCALGKDEQLFILAGSDGAASKLWMAELESLRQLIMGWESIFRAPRMRDLFVEEQIERSQMAGGNITSSDGSRSSEWSLQEQQDHMDRWTKRKIEAPIDKLSGIRRNGLFMPLDPWVSGREGDLLSVGIKSQRLSFDATLTVRRGSDALKDMLRPGWKALEEFDSYFLEHGDALLTTEDLTLAGGDDAVSQLRRVLRNTHFLGPHREGRDSEYPYRDRLTLAPQHDQVVNEWLAALGVPYEVLPLSVEGLSPEDANALTREELHTDWADEPRPTGTGMRFLKDLRAGVEVTVDQVGYGVSQLLPIIDVCVAEPANLILIEQPELHLHPRLQSNLGELFASAVRRGHQVVAETHSENILLRVSNLIRQGKIGPDEVKVLYVDNDEEGVRVEQIRLGERGEQLDPWPTGFFDDSLNDILGITG